MSPTGIVLARAFFDEVVEPLLAQRFAGLPYAAGRLGSGSDVLGLDDSMSRDHDWGLRLSLFVPADEVNDVQDQLEWSLPTTFRDLPVRFPFTGETTPRHHVEVDSVSGFVRSRLGFDPSAGASPRDWLSLTGQAALEITAGPVFADAHGELESVRGALEWYPHDVWRYVLACDWQRLAQELPLLGRAGDVGDDTGSRVIVARLAQIAMHLGFLIEQRWPPYAKWFGTAFRRLDCGTQVGASVEAALRADDPAGRQDGIAAALQSLLERQNEAGLTSVVRATVPFWDRPFVHPDPAIAAQLLDGIHDAPVRALPRGRGSVEQRTDNVDVLTDVRARRAAVAD